MEDKDRQNTDVLDAIKAREIVREIMDFGANQSQILNVIKFLSLELEDRELMLRLREVLGEETQSKIEI